MPKFSYVAKLGDGRRVTGSLEAVSQAAVLEALHLKGLIVINLKKASGTAASQLFLKRVGMDDLAIFTRQMATLVDAGIPIVAGLEAVSEQIENRTLQGVVLKVRAAVEGGANFTAAIAKQSTVFSPLFISMIRAGEASGHLAEILERLSTYLEKSASLQRKIRAACIYPVIVISMAALITGVLMLKVIPTFKQIFVTLGVSLPLPTRILIGISEFAQHSFLPGIGAGFVGLFLLRRLLKTPSGRLGFDRMLLRLWVIGTLVRKVSIAKFARTLSTLVKTGVPILSALEIVSDTAGNRVVADAVLKVRASIREGENIAGPLTASKVFPPLVVRMISVGEQTGRLDEMLTKVAEFYEDQVEVAIGGLTSALEPMIIGILGLVVGSIVFSILLPIFKLTEVLGK
ncbi:MAG: type II secretion system F family protein [Candidatus Omnitrophica bacterium]|nr:type II secretion system F family protein [Candidatus Omnitrophota bacterium]